MVWLGLMLTRLSGSLFASPLFPHALAGMLSRDGLARFVSPLVPSRACWTLSRDGLARSALCLPTCFHFCPHLFPHALAGLDAVTRWSGSGSSLSPHIPFVFSPGSSRACWAGCCHEMVRLAQLPTLLRCCHEMVWLDLSPHLFPHALAGCCHEMVWLGQLFVSPLLSICVPACFLTRLLGWMLSRDGLARSAVCLPTCFHLSPRLFPHALAGLGAVTRRSGSLSPHLFPFVSPLVSSRACWAGRWSVSVSSLSPHLFPSVPPLVSSRACWAGCCHEMVWLDQLFASPPVSFCLPARFLTRLLGWMMYEMVWRGQLFVSPLVSFCLPTSFLTRLLGWMLSQDGLARSALCLPTCLHLSPHEVVWLGQLFDLPLVTICLPNCFLTRLLGQLFVALVSPPVSSRACWVGWCHEMVWVGQLFVSTPVSFCLPTCFLTRLLDWMLSRDGPARLLSICLPTSFLTRLLGCCHRMVWLDHLFFSLLVSFCLPACSLTRLLDAVTRWSASVSPTCFLTRLLGCCQEMVWLSSLSPTSPPVSSRACWAGCCHEMVWLGQLFVSACSK